MGFVDKLTGTLTPSTIDDFKSTVAKKGGLAKGNKFAISMVPPSAAGGGLLNTDIQGLAASALSGNFSMKNVINDPRDISILCQTCSLPGKSFQTMDYSKGGVLSNRKFITDVATSDVTFTFHLTNDYYIRKVFDKWMDLCFNIGNKKVKYSKEYKTDIGIQQLDQNNVPIYGVKLLGAFPISFDRTILSNNLTETQTFSATMTYDDYVPEGALQSALTGVATNLQPITRFLN